MILGTFDSNSGKYCFNNKWYKPRWYANALRSTIPECKLICEEAYSATPAKQTKSVLVVGKAKWQEIVSGGFGSWVGLTKFHYYDSTLSSIGATPSWLADAASYDNLLIHEYIAGKVAFLKDWELNNIYQYFVDTTAPPVDSGDTSGTGDNSGSTDPQDGGTVATLSDAIVDLKIAGFIPVRGKITFGGEG